MVTGGAGFIGCHLIDLLLNKGNKVVCVDNLYLGKVKNIEHQMCNKYFKFHKIDVLDFKNLNELFKKEKFDVAFHLVVNSDIKQSYADTNLDLRLNLLSTY
ncbi:MAG: GDP-mannose 4,6-dehydratase [Planctomycetota bacterium]